MSHDDEVFDYEYDDELDHVREGGGSRTGMYWAAGLTLAMLSLLAGYLIGGARGGGDDEPVAQVVTETASAKPTSPGSTSAAPSSDAPSPSESASPSSSAAVKPDAELIAAVSAAGDIVLADPDTAQVVRTLVPAAGDRPEADPSIAWNAKAGVVYFTRAGCAIWRHQIDGAATEQIGSGRRIALSPNGKYLALWTCNPGPGAFEIMQIDNRKTLLSLPLTTAAPDAGGGMSQLSDIDWRPDGTAIVVTEGWEGDDVQYLITLAKPPKSVQSGSRIPVKGVNGSYHAVEYVGSQLVMSGTCCPPDAATSHVVLRDRKTGTATKIAQLSDIGLVRVTADGKGRLRYLRRPGADGPGAMWALDDLKGEAREAGGQFIAIDW
ncbi:MAG: hypothetical protein ABIM89_12935 [Mycobacteriales bacterium]